MKKYILYAFYYGSCGLKMNDFSVWEDGNDDNTEVVMTVDLVEVQCPKNVVRKEN